MGKVSSVVFIGSLGLLACSADAAGSLSAPRDAGMPIDAATGPDGAQGDGSGPGACEVPPAQGEFTVGTERFNVTGTSSEGVVSYLGVPYAAAPVGELRYRAPEPAPCQAETLTASAYGAVCPQYQEGKVIGNEDCLTLNLWKPEAATLAPVMFWIHGGGSEQGSGSLPAYAGEALAKQYGVIVVTFNYRLGPLGYLAHPALSAESQKGSGHYGSLDQLAALRWVHDNVQAFGGDPEHVLIFGQSAGGVSVCSLVASPIAKGLFSAAIIQSGACTATPLATAEKAGQTVANELGCKDESNAATCLREKSMAEILATLAPAANGTTSLRLTYSTVVDGYFLADAPRDAIAAGKHNRVPIIIGTTSSESGRDTKAVADADAFRQEVTRFFAGVNLPAAAIDAAIAAYPVSEYDGDYRKALVALTSDVKFVCTARKDARAFAAAQSEPVYHYWFDHVFDVGGTKVKAAGAFHGIDVVYTFGTFDAFGIPPGAADRRVSASLQGYFTRLAANLDPNEAPELTFPRYDEVRSLAIADPLSSVEDIRKEQCDFWESLAKK